MNLRILEKVGGENSIHEQWIHHQLGVLVHANKRLK